MQEHVFVVRIFSSGAAMDSMRMLAEMLANGNAQAVVEHSHTAEKILITPIAGTTAAN